jgi:hypothetical protein
MMRPGYTEIVPVLVEPAAGHSDEEIAAALTACGATDVQILAPGFLSANAPGAALASLETIAYVHQKSVKQMHRR